MTSRGLAISLRFLVCAPPLKVAGLLEVQAHCPRAERLASRSLGTEHPGLGENWCQKTWSKGNPKSTPRLMA
jgi:hypothetical protein